MRIGPRAMPQHLPDLALSFHVHGQMGHKGKAIVIIGDQTRQGMAADQLQRMFRVVELGGQVHGEFGVRSLTIPTQ